MSSRWRRFEVLLPTQFNDGRDIPPEWLAEAVLEIVDHFGAASYDRNVQSFQEFWVFRQGPDAWLLSDIRPSHDSTLLTRNNIVAVTTAGQYPGVFSREHPPW